MTAKPKSVQQRWQTTARNRLRIELAGLAFAVRHGFTPEEYASELWGRGASGWMGEHDPQPLDYLRHEAEGLTTFYPWVNSTRPEVVDGHAQITLSGGSLAGWGEDPWELVRSAGLTEEEFRRYCREAFRVWGQQIGLSVTLDFRPDGTCVLGAAKEK